ncbi:hypothetical protein [uncultured Ilumatobacter sp.]|uniref:hypothetical protein n=1 Tax=uncultured Ilumatobacter sp. TaxID=879968 RepID=UPI00374F22E2
MPEASFCTIVNTHDIQMPVAKIAAAPIAARGVSEMTAPATRSPSAISQTKTIDCGTAASSQPTMPIASRMSIPVWLIVRWNTAPSNPPPRVPMTTYDPTSVALPTPTITASRCPVAAVRRQSQQRPMAATGARGATKSNFDADQSLRDAHAKVASVDTPVTNHVDLGIERRRCPILTSKITMARAATTAA